MSRLIERAKADVKARVREEVGDEAVVAASRLREQIPPDEPQPSQCEAGRNRRQYKRDLIAVTDAIAALDTPEADRG